MPVTTARPPLDGVPHERHVMTAPLAQREAARGLRVNAVGLTVSHGAGTRALDDVTVEIEPGRLTAIIGLSGSGKSTLLRVLARIAPAHAGTVTYTVDESIDRDAVIGFVPQDDILHMDLPLRPTLRHAAGLRIDAPRAVRDAAVDDAMRILGLSDRGDVAVRALSGGQRKRASIACEILIRPGVCFLDEPTSGLDPAAAANLVAHLRHMCADGSTVVFTTHNVEDVSCSDQVIVLGRGGRLVASGTPSEVLGRIGARTFVDLYERLTRDDFAATAAPERPVAPSGPPRRQNPHIRPGVARQWWVLTHRSMELLVANRLTLAITAGSPAAVIAMFAMLFRRGDWHTWAVNPVAAVQVSYWLAFSGFFFGLTFRLLQVCTEVAVLRRERHAGVRTAAYLGSKLALLVPSLLLVDLAMLVVLRMLGRIPNLSLHALAALFVTMGLNSIAALCLGLLASAVVRTPAQAALALPMLCFPAVLFAGAVVPLPLLTGVGRMIAAVLPDRWAFEAIAGRFGVNGSPGSDSSQAWLGTSALSVYWSLLALFTVALVAVAYAAVRGRAAGRRD